MGVRVSSGHLCVAEAPTEATAETCADRKNMLTNAGYDYNAVQKRVNELMK